MNPYIVKELLHYCNVSLKSSNKIESAPIKYYDFTFVLKGRLIYTVNGKTYNITENDAVLIPPGSVRERRKIDESAKYASFNFTVYDDSVIPQGVYFPDIISHDIRRLVSIFSASHISDVYSTREKVINLLNYILLEIKDILDFDSNNKHIIEIIKFINVHISEPLSLSRVSAEVNLSKEYTSHIFKKETGKTVTDYINERKLLIAKEMLLGTEYSLTEISDRLGYENYSYFSKLFKNQFGTSPRALKNSHKK